MAEAGGGPPPGSLRLLKKKIKSERRVGGGDEGGEGGPRRRGSGRRDSREAEVGRDGTGGAGAGVTSDSSGTAGGASSERSGGGGAGGSSGGAGGGAGGGRVVGAPGGGEEGGSAPAAARDSVSLPEGELKVIEKRVVEWRCGTCDRTCIPVREESRCLCGHRLKEHPSEPPSGGGGKPFACRNGRCACRRFFFVVAEGAWVLRCRCKHKGIEHDAGKAPHLCKKPKCTGCTGFDSPWVCNCAHPWADHKQSFVKRKLYTLNGRIIPTEMASELNFVLRGEGEG
mmetsp:Transcript_15178/g.52740  ORF Transcript_15178/g.52740 Transcript_15178/m.52740 type:complete len:284 (-) Transcript_15178:94-945(-)